MVNNSSMFREDHGLNKYYYSLRLGYRKKLIEEIALTSIYQKNPKDILGRRRGKNSNQIKTFNILEKLCLILREILFEESSLLNNTNSNLIHDFRESLLRINRILKSVINKIIISCIQDIIIESIF